MKTEIKKVLLLIAIAMSNIGIVQSAEVDNVLLLKFKDGQSVEFRLLDYPNITFDSDYTYIKSKTMTSAVSYAYSEIEKIVFSKSSESSVPSIEEDKNKLVFEYLDANTVLISGVEDANKYVRIYSTEGKAVQTDVQRDDNQVRISLSGLNSGVYIIKVDKYSFKIYKK